MTDSTYQRHGIQFEQDVALIEELRRVNRELANENRSLRRDAAGTYRLENVIGVSPAMKETLRVVERAIDSDATVLISGETGTGKKIIARAIHYNGPRREHRFITQNCSSLPEALLESELFGRTKDQRGIFEQAAGGTLFLDEIGDMPMSMQVKLLHVLEEGQVRRIGSSDPRRVDVRVLAATHKNLRQEAEIGHFRPDLYYRLDVLRIPVPPLRERRDDVILLVRHFLEKYESRAGKQLGGIAPRALQALREHTFPGNVRELENEIERAVALANPGQLLDIDLLSNEIVGEPALVRPTGTDGEASASHSSLRGRMREIERRMITQELLKNNGNRTHSAAKLGISVRALQKKIHLLDIKA